MKRFMNIYMFIILIVPINALADKYYDNNDGTITDTSTGLVWQINIIDQQKTWGEALEYCNNFNLNGERWRLPNVKELQTIVNYDIIPAIDYMFNDPNSVLSNYWTSTSSASVHNRAWQIHFVSGRVTDGSTKDGTAYARCVR